MTIAAVHRPHALVLPSAGLITQFTQFSPNRNFEILRQKSQSDAAAQWSGVISAAPQIDFTSPQIKAVLDPCTNAGLCVGWDPTSTGTVSAYYRKGKNRGLREAVASSVHDRFDLTNNAFLYWMSLSAEAGRQAEIQAILKAVSNDGLNPFVHVGSSALAGALTAGATFTLGPQSVNGSTINGVVRVTIENQIQTQDERTDGWAYAMYADIEDWQPQIRIETNDIAVMDTFEEPVAVTACNSYFRHVGQNSLPTANATGSHVRISGTQGMAVATEGSGVRGRFVLTITLDKPNAATAPLIVNTATAIT